MFWHSKSICLTLICELHFYLMQLLFMANFSDSTYIENDYFTYRDLGNILSNMGLL